MVALRLPFTRDQFFSIFASYNELLLPFAAALWVFSLAALIVLFRRARTSSGFINIVLVTHWLWSAFAYHFAFFSRVNPAAWLFGVLFVIQAILLLQYGVLSNRLRYSCQRSLRHLLARGMILYALIYPVINLLEGHVLPRVPTFGVPCPTTILTIGFLLAADRPLPRLIVVVPIVWSVVGGSAAFLLGVRADLMLLGTGFVLFVHQISLAQRFLLRIAGLKLTHLCA
jgi:uncharacterized protein DUF6064